VKSSPLPRSCCVTSTLAKLGARRFRPDDVPVELADLIVLAVHLQLLHRTELSWCPGAFCSTTLVQLADLRRNISTEATQVLA